MEANVARLWERIETLIGSSHPDVLVAEIVRASVEELLENPARDAAVAAHG